MKAGYFAVRPAPHQIHDSSEKMKKKSSNISPCALSALDDSIFLEDEFFIPGSCYDLLRVECRKR
jgi:hypothetical protein